MDVWHRRTAAASTHLYVTGSVRRGYRITRQVLGPSDEIETNWRLTAAQSRQLHAALAPVTVSDTLQPQDPDCDFDRVLREALEALDPPPAPFTFHSWD